MTKPGRRVWGWMFFDWASQPYLTLLLTFIFGPYFTSAIVTDSVRGQEYWGWMLAGVGVLVALLAPLLGSMADASGSRLRWVAAFSVVHAGAACSLWWAHPGSPHVAWILVAFGAGLLAVEFSTIFTNAMLPGLGDRSQIGVISGSGWAFGYAGGLLALLLVLAFLAENDSGLTLIGAEPVLGLDPAMREGTRAVGPFTAIWYLAFMVPFFLWVREGPTVAGQGAVSGLVTTIRNLPRQRSLLAFLLSSMFYRDALSGLYAFGGIYAAGVLGWSIVDIGVFGTVSLVFGAVFSWLGGFADRRFGPAKVIIFCIALLAFACAVILSTSREVVFFIPVAANSPLADRVFLACGCLIGAGGGILQAASRTMMVIQANPRRMTEAFGLYALSGKATAFLAPMLVAIATGVFDDQRIGAMPLILLFLAGILLMYMVDPEGYRDDRKHNS